MSHPREKDKEEKPETLAELQDIRDDTTVTSLNEFARKYGEHLTVPHAVGTVKAELFFLNRFLKYRAEINVAELAAVTGDIMRDYQVHLYEELQLQGRAQRRRVPEQQPEVSQKPSSASSRRTTIFPAIRQRTLPMPRPRRDCPGRSSPDPKQRRSSMRPTPRPSSATATGPSSKCSTNRDREGRGDQPPSYGRGLSGRPRPVNSGKGNKDRVVPIGKIACRYIENYIKAIRPSLIRDPYNNHLFLSMKGSHLSKSVVGEIVKRYGKKRRSRRTSRRTPSGIRAPRSCSGTKRTSGTSRSCSATRLSQRKCTHTSASRT